MKTYEEQLNEAAKYDVEKWFIENDWVATEAKVIPALAAHKLGAEWERERSEKLLQFIEDQVVDKYFDMPIEKRFYKEAKESNVSLSARRIIKEYKGEL